MSDFDFSQYKNWEKVVAPGGQVYYVVPETGMLYSPSQSAIAGRPVLYNDTRTEAAKANAKEKQQEEIAKAQKNALSPTGQLIPVAGAVGGTVLGAAAINNLASGPATIQKAIQLADGGTKLIYSDGTVKVLDAAGQIISDSAASTAASQAFAAGTGAVPQAPEIVGANFTTGTGSSVAPGLESLGLIGRGAAGIGGALGAYDLATNDRGPALGALEGAASGAGIGTAIAPGPGTAIGAVVGGVAGLVKGLFEHTSTKEIQEKRERGVAKSNPAYAEFWAGVQADRKAHPEIKNGYNPAQSKDFVGVDPGTGLWTNNLFATGGTAGKKYDVANLHPEDIWGTPDFFKQYPDWLQKSEEERKQIAQQALDAKAVRASKGGIYVDWKKLATPEDSQEQVSQIPSVPNRAFDNPKSIDIGKALAGQQNESFQRSAVSTNKYGGVRLSPGVYKDVKTGKVYYSPTGAR